jgi:hypothetical protein
MVEVVQTLKRKVDSFELFVKIKDFAIKDVQSRINFMCNALRRTREFGKFSEEEKEKKEEECRKVEEIRMLDDTPSYPLASLENCTLDEVISILQNHVCDPTINSNQAGFGSFVAYHVIKEKIDRYHKKSMVPPKLRNLWELRIYLTIGKITWPVILDLGSSVSTIPKSLCDHLDSPPIEKCDVGLKLADCSITNAHIVGLTMFLLNYI